MTRRGGNGVVDVLLDAALGEDGGDDFARLGIAVDDGAQQAAERVLAAGGGGRNMVEVIGYEASLGLVPSPVEAPVERVGDDAQAARAREANELLRRHVVFPQEANGRQRGRRGCSGGRGGSVGRRRWHAARRNED